MKHTSKLGLAIIGLVLSSTAFAGELHEKKGKRHGPPPVAIEACVAAVDGDACSFEGRHGDALSGQCATDKEEVLACRPEGTQQFTSEFSDESATERSFAKFNDKWFFIYLS